jgi:hypothetical protein
MDSCEVLVSNIFFSSTKIRIFFSATLGIRIFFLEKNHNPPFKLNGCSLSLEIKGALNEYKEYKY